MVQEFDWSRAQVTSGNFYSKLIIGPLFGFAAGWIVDRFGPRRMMIAGILMAGTALVGLSYTSTLGLFIASTYSTLSDMSAVGRFPIRC